MFFLIILSSVLNRLFLQFLTLLEDRFFASEVYIINHTQCPQTSIDGYVQGFPETTLLKPAPLPSERLHIEHAYPSIGRKALLYR
jgi:hypothetical protein